MKKILPLVFILSLSCSKDPSVILPDSPPPLPATLEEQLRGSWKADYLSYAFDVAFDPGIGVEIPFTSRGVIEDPVGSMEFFPSAFFMDYVLTASINFNVPVVNFPVPIPISLLGSGDYEVRGKVLRVGTGNRLREFEVLSHGPFHLTLATKQPSTVPLLGAIEIDLIINYVFDDEI
ncbi:MAG: hypothetical protein EA358_00925 [Flavobacteriales bacterium]|nr:MAG: hypothetical protein EA358_00925 [Flavobacteriales bacterium]